MRFRGPRARAIALLIAAFAGGAAHAATKPASSPLLPGANSKVPISIEADKLTYDLTTGEAIVEVDPPSGDKRPRVTGVFIQGSGGAVDDANKQPAAKKDAPATSRDKPKTATKQAPSGATPLKSSGT